MSEQSSYEEIIERAREIAAQKRLEGDVPPDLSNMLDQVFIEVAPPGAPTGGDGLEAMVDVLGRYRFDPSIRVETSRRGPGKVSLFVKRLLRPIAAWQLRHLTDQLNAYHAAQTELLRELIRKLESSPED